MLDASADASAEFRHLLVSRALEKRASLGSVIEVPEVVSNKALAAGAGAWLDDLPALVAELEIEWDFTAGVPYTDGTEAYVASVTMGNGESAVMKLLVPRDGEAAANEIAVLRLAAGDGCAELYRHDAERGALLMEQLGPSIYQLGLPVDERHRVLCDLAERLWRPGQDVVLPTGAEKATWLIDHITRLWNELDQPCSERAFEDALSCAERRRDAHDDSRALIIHGDVHQWNALRSHDGYKLIDPDGLLAEPEYDLGIIMREDPLELVAEGDPWRRAHWLAERTGLDATAIWEWGVVERVSTGLLATKIDLQPIGREMLAAADQVAG